MVALNTAILATALLTTLQFSHVLAIPQVTNVATDGYDIHANSPVPTNTPTVKELLRRMMEGKVFEKRAFTTTCGYFAGVTSLPYYCGSGAACSTNTALGYFGCCPINSLGSMVGSDCPGVNNPYTSCVPYESAAGCTGACYNQNRVCNSANPFCGVDYMTGTFGTYTTYACNSVIRNLVLTVVPSPTTDVYPGDSSTTSYSSTTTTPRTTTTTTRSSSSSSSSSSSTQSTTTSATTTDSGFGQTTTTAAISPTPAPKSNVGAIAGGTVGGVLGLAAIIGAVVFFLKRRKSTEFRQSRLEVSQVTDPAPKQ